MLLLEKWETSVGDWLKPINKIYGDFHWKINNEIKKINRSWKMYEFRKSFIERFANVILDLCNCTWRWNGQVKKNRLNAHHLSWYKASVRNAYHSIIGIGFEGASSSSIYILCLALEICWTRGKCESKDRLTRNDFLVKSTSNSCVLLWTLKVDNK